MLELLIDHHTSFQTVYHHISASRTKMKAGKVAVLLLLVRALTSPQSVIGGKKMSRCTEHDKDNILDQCTEYVKRGSRATVPPSRSSPCCKAVQEVRCLAMTCHALWIYLRIKRRVITMKVPSQLSKSAAIVILASFLLLQVQRICPPQNMSVRINGLIGLNSYAHP